MDNVAATALTIGQCRTPRGLIGGYILKVDARHGVKSLSPASEGYFLDPSAGSEPLHAVIWALTHILFLQMEQRPLTLFLCDTNLAQKCAGLLAGLSEAQNFTDQVAIRLFATLTELQVQICIKGKFFDRMQAKLNQLHAYDSNELVQIDVQAIADAMAASSDLERGLKHNSARGSSRQP